MAIKEGGGINNNLNLRWISKDVTGPLPPGPPNILQAHKHKTEGQSRISFKGLLVFCLVSFNCVLFLHGFVLLGGGGRS